MSEDYRLSRRDAVKLAGAGLAATAFVGSATAHAGAVEGDSQFVGDGSAHAYVEYERGRGRLTGMGVRLSNDALNNLPQQPADWPPAPLPSGTPFGVEYHLDLPRGNTGHFSHVGLDWNPEGHPPSDYVHPHFDVHFYLPRESEIDAIPPGVATYSIPDALMPASTGFAPVREVVPGMGEHLGSFPISFPDYPGQPDWSVFIWGAYDLDGDGEGRMIFMEPMVTVAYLEGLSVGAEIRRDIPMPERFYDGGWYPTEFVVARDEEGYQIALESFEHFPGYDG